MPRSSRDRRLQRLTVQVALEHRPGDEDLIEMRDWLEAELD